MKKKNEKKLSLVVAVNADSTSDGVETPASKHPMFLCWGSETHGKLFSADLLEGG